MSAASPSKRSLTSKVLRFPLVGAMSSGIYALGTALCIAQWHMAHELASLSGYLMALPFSFFGHRNFTFGANGRISAELLRFCGVHAIGIALSWTCMTVVDRLHLHYAFGIVGAVVLVPVVSFLILDRWVFRAD